MNYKSDRGELSTELVFDRFEGENAILILGGKECIIPLVMLPKQIGKGDTIVATLATNEADTKRREMKAKEILNEILHI